MSLRSMKIQVIHFHFTALIFTCIQELLCPALNTSGLGNSISTHCTSPAPHTLCGKCWMPLGNLLQVTWSCSKIFTQESGRNVPIHSALVEMLHISSLFKYLYMYFTFE